MTDKQRQLEDIRLVVNRLGKFDDEDNSYKRGWNDCLDVLKNSINPILDRPLICCPIETSLAERTRLVKRFKGYCISKRIDFCPTSLLGWMDSEGYLNTDKIKADLEKEKEELGDE